jgi:hypothetical protein
MQAVRWCQGGSGELRSVVARRKTAAGGAESGPSPGKRRNRPCGYCEELVHKRQRRAEEFNHSGSVIIRKPEGLVKDDGIYHKSWTAIQIHSTDGRCSE